MNLIAKMKSVKYKIKIARNLALWMWAKTFQKDRVRRIEDQVVSAYVKILGRLPDDKRRFAKAILEGSISTGEMERDLIQTAEYEERLGRYCRMYGYDAGELQPGFMPPLFPGDAAFRRAAAGYQDFNPGDKDRHTKDNLVTLVSTWGIRCGIATYTGHLAGTMKKLGLLAEVVPLHNGKPSAPISGKIAHFQHEFGILPKAIEIPNKILITWHTVKEDMRDVIRKFESAGSVVGHIVHSEEAARCISSAQPAGEVYVVSHGSKIIAPVKKEDARELLGLQNLGIKPGEAFGFVFGFQSGNKLYEEIIEVARKAGIKLVISGALHESGHKETVGIRHHVVFLQKFLSDTEIDLWALASDLLIFDYKQQKHYSVSGALHRVIGAGRPVVCSRTRHFTDLREGVDVLKFESPEELEQKIKEALADRDGYGKKALDYALRTSWENAAKRHMELYKKHADMFTVPETFDADYYDKNYYAVKNVKSFENSDGTIGHWSYANPEAEWLGC